MKKTLFGLVAGLAAAFGANAQVSVPYQEIPYNVHYKWGLVDLMIAHGRATIQTSGNQFTATLDGNSIPWEGRVFCIADTLVADMTPQPAGLSRETVTYQNGWYMKPKVAQFNSGGFNPDDPANYKNIHGQGALDADGQTMEAVTITSDMLALFYYFREIDFPAMSAGQTVNIPISGGFAREAMITYNGENAGAYDVTFQYTYQSAPSGYPVHATVDPESRVPQTMTASLPIGHLTLIKE